jgi:hypothetical protein
MAIVLIGGGSLAGLLSPFLDQEVGHGVGIFSPKLRGN